MRWSSPQTSCRNAVPGGASGRSNALRSQRVRPAARAAGQRPADSSSGASSSASATARRSRTPARSAHRKPTAIRAAGAANGANPVSIVIPVHRVVGERLAHGLQRRARGETLPAGSRARARVRAHVTSWPARLLLLGAIWGMSFVLIKVGNRPYASPGLVRAVLFGLLALTPVLLAQRGRRTTGAPGATRGGGVPSQQRPVTLFAFGEQHVSSVLAGIWNGTTPLSCCWWCCSTLPEERPTRERVVGLAIGFAGVLVVLGAWRGIARGELVGSAACLAAAILYGIGFPYLRRYLATGGLAIAVLALVSSRWARCSSRSCCRSREAFRGVRARPAGGGRGARRHRDGRGLSAQLLDHPRCRGDLRVHGHLPRARIRNDRGRCAAGRAPDLERAGRRAAGPARRGRQPGPRGLGRPAREQRERVAIRSLAPCARCEP